jgi:hypothetical protein
MTFVATPWSAPSAVWCQLTVPPTEEPMTLSEAKIRAGLDGVWPAGDARELLLTDFIREARSQVEHDTGLALLTQTHEIEFLAAICPAQRVPMPSQTLPAQSITNIETGRVVPVRYAVGGAPLVFTEGVAAGTRVRVVSGWPSATALKMEAPALYHAYALLVAHYATMGRDLAVVGDVAAKTEARYMPMGYEDAIAPYRLVWVI